MEQENYPDGMATVDKLQQLRDTVEGVSVTFRGRELRAESVLNMLRIEILEPNGDESPDELIAVVDKLADQLRGEDIPLSDGESPDRVLDAAKHHIECSRSVME